jgi:hypothetical protein
MAAARAFFRSAKMPMPGFESCDPAARFYRSYDELRNFLRPRSNRNQHVPTHHRRLHVLSRSLTKLSILRAASLQTVNLQLASKVDELDHKNSDLKNLFENTQLATIFLHPYLVIRSTGSPGA